MKGARMEAKDVIPQWELTETAEVLFNFRNAMDIAGIKSVLWQLANSSFKAGRLEGIKEVVEWIQHNLIYIALEYNGTPSMHLQTNEHKSAEKWQAKLKEWAVPNP